MSNDAPFHPLLNAGNPIKDKLAAGRTCFGLFLVSASALIAECCATRGPDWLLVDMEASPADRRDLIQMLQALNGSRTAGMVRVARNERHLIEAALDSGAQGLMVPKVDSAADARAVANCAYYPPRGRRGVNPIRCSAYFSRLPDYFAEANQSLLTIVQIESAQAVAEADDIAAVDGIDVLFIGCGDLACDLGQAGQVTGALMDAAIEQVLEACHRHGKIAGIFAYSLELAQRYARQGFRFIAFGNDMKLLAQSLEQQMRSLEEFASP
ncbi:HpcH/HpaI aldolase family protein [Chromobacterium subtsugae]|uniref:HpcH/HpaI aldolase family protein n=1 Tax=Chromobacterium subtsugae TaxID=251747 RepID=UPI0009BC1695|nr:aldolase/citrate lyase family protein [Chromobacterium subtsugae]